MKTWICFLSIFYTFASFGSARRNQEPKPNILFFITDDQSHEHTSKAGCEFVQTPYFDRVANEGVFFTNAYVASPGCSPSRAAILTGRYPWQIEEAGTHASSFPAKYEVYPDILEENGYFIGYTGKGWGPGKWDVSGRSRNPAGPEFNKNWLQDKIYTGTSSMDYVANFRDFLESNRSQKPFCFWLGTHEPYRIFELDSYKRKNKGLIQAKVPDFLPDTEIVRGDLLDYAVEIEYADQVLGKVMEILDSANQLENTLVVVTSDNGMAFPRAKANAYDHGIHVPLAIRWGNKIFNNKVVNTPVSLIDLAPTFLEAAGIAHNLDYSGQSLFKVMLPEGNEKISRPIFSARERHSSSRYRNWSYPQRAMREGDYLYIINFKPDRWPAGDPKVFNNDGDLIDGFHDIDACPTKSFLLENRNNPEYQKYFKWAMGKRPEQEMYDLTHDPYCLRNLVLEEGYQDKTEAYRDELHRYLEETGDPRVGTDHPDIFEEYPRLSGRIRKFPPPK